MPKSRRLSAILNSPATWGFAAILLAVPLLLVPALQTSPRNEMAATRGELHGLYGAFQYYASLHDGEYPPELEPLIGDWWTEEAITSSLTNSIYYYFPTPPDGDCTWVILMDEVSVQGGERGCWALFEEREVKWLDANECERLLECNRRAAAEAE